jgi:signal transduction histidine kinase
MTTLPTTASQPTQALQHVTTLMEMKAHTACFYRVDHKTLLHEIVDTFDNDLSITGVIVLDGLRKHMVLSRVGTERILARPYCRELFLNKPVDTLMDVWPYEPMEFPGSTPVSDAVNLALQRPVECRYEPIIAVEDDQTFYLLDLFPLLNEQCRSLSSALVDLKRQQEARRQAESERERLHHRLVALSRQSGMAEIATGVLHNVGNVLNSVNVSANTISNRLQQSRLPNFGKALELFSEHQNDLGEFLTTHEKGLKLPGYLGKLFEALNTEQQQIADELDALLRSVEHIKHIVTAQQSHAKVTVTNEQLQIEDLIEDAIAMNRNSLDRHGVRIKRDLCKLPSIQADRHMVLQIMVNLVSNAKKAVGANPVNDRQIHIATTIVEQDGKRYAALTVTDNGVGIMPDDIEKLFTRGFTTRKDGHGFGLHNSANNAAMMKGTLTANSRGMGHGASFTLALPLKQTATQDTPQEIAA